MVASLNYEAFHFFFHKIFHDIETKNHIRLMYFDMKISQCIHFIYRKWLLSCGFMVDTNKDQD